ncbi:hypothetical protein [Caldicellulosiruptor morganii]|uniref:Uncharacterized protein n=1 Tax=Caldicellulosiruptor morganii TaxID=1387555 RepID=A0ABY7BNJ5_9FIRM|nr:hypothetical protein [Caldicellulosiruptor morganii]WAM34413.1 hypothetical protein OTK00_000613 [Caldicellulosiruptor morganii]
MELRVKILIVTILIALLPSSIVAVYVMTNLIPQYEKIVYEYFVNQQKRSLEKITQKAFDDINSRCI